jgi:hypothetical protein
LTGLLFLVFPFLKAAVGRIYIFFRDVWASGPSRAVCNHPVSRACELSHFDFILFPSHSCQTGTQL